MKTLPKMQSSLQTAQHLNAMVAALSRESDLEVVRDNEAGTVAVSVKGRNLTVFRAIEKQKGGAWIVSAMAGLLSQI
jgi:nitrogen fixation protein FixH